MTASTDSKKGRGKPLGHRAHPELYAEILRVLKEDKESGGDGMSANAIGKALGQNDMTTREYANDLVDEKKLTVKEIHARMVLYRLPRAKSVPIK